MGLSFLPNEPENLGHVAFPITAGTRHMDRKLSECPLILKDVRSFDQRYRDF